MSIGGIIGVLGFQHLLLAEGVDKGRASCAREREDVSLCQLKRIIKFENTYLYRWHRRPSDRTEFLS